MEGHCDYVMSRDSDSLVFGARGLIKDINLNNNRAEIIMLDELLGKLGLTMEQFVDLCILIGSDYNRGIMSPARALKSVREVDISKMNLSEADLKAIIDTRDIFTKKYNHDHVITSDVAVADLTKFLHKFGLSESKIALGLKRMDVHT
jgi:flap endonuclease-1